MEAKCPAIAIRDN